MQLSKSWALKRAAQVFAKPVSSILLTKSLQNKVRIAEAYFAFLQGKGSGEGWDLVEEVKAATDFVYREHPIVFDVGANKGKWSEKFLKIIPNAKIYQFDPAPECQKILHELGLPNSEVIPFALGQEKGEGDLYSPEAASGVASLYERNDSYLKKHSFSKTKISISTIDAFVSERSINFVDFIKLDVEGCELDALKGAESTLMENKIGALSFEFGSGMVNSRTFFRDFWNLLKSRNFSLFRVTPAGKLLEVSDYYEDLEYFRAVSNYIAVLNNHPYKL